MRVRVKLSKFNLTNKLNLDNFTLPLINLYFLYFLPAGYIVDFHLALFFCYDVTCADKTRFTVAVSGHDLLSSIR